MSNIASHTILRQRRHRTINTLHTWLLAAGSLTLLGVTAWIFGGVIGVVAALVFGSLSMAAIGRISPQMVLRMYKTEPVDRMRFPEGVAIVDELARRAGLPTTPQLHVVPSRLMNAFAVGRRDESAIAISDALVRRMTLRELAGVLAHEISHIANEDVRVMAFADMVSRYTSVMSTVGILSLFINIGGFAGGYEVPIPWPAVVLLVFAPTIGGLLQLALSRTREFDADLGAAILTGDPDGLAMALTKLERAQRGMWEQLMLPAGRIPDPSILRSHPPTAERIARLMALKEDGTPHVRQPEGPARIVRASVVPRIPLGPWQRSNLDEGAARSFAEIDPRAPIFEQERGREPAGESGLCNPAGRPRIRFRRGGVWW